ncbi:hypothetical protein HK097_006568, partial [Rhizophlyctis rosea]
GVEGEKEVAEVKGEGGAEETEELETVEGQGDERTDVGVGDKGGQGKEKDQDNGDQASIGCTTRRNVSSGGDLAIDTSSEHFIRPPSRQVTWDQNVDPAEQEDNGFPPTPFVERENSPFAPPPAQEARDDPNEPEPRLKEQCNKNDLMATIVKIRDHPEILSRFAIEYPHFFANCKQALDPKQPKLDEIHQSQYENFTDTFFSSPAAVPDAEWQDEVYRYLSRGSDLLGQLRDIAYTEVESQEAQMVIIDSYLGNRNVSSPTEEAESARDPWDTVARAIDEAQNSGEDTFVRFTARGELLRDDEFF